VTESSRLDDKNLIAGLERGSRPRRRPKWVDRWPGNVTGSPVTLESPPDKLGSGHRDVLQLFTIHAARQTMSYSAGTRRSHRSIPLHRIGSAQADWRRALDRALAVRPVVEMLENAAVPGAGPSIPFPNVVVDPGHARRGLDVAFHADGSTLLQ